MADIIEMKNEDVKKEKISVADYLGDRYLLELRYTPFDVKMGVVSEIMNNVISTIGGLNTTFLRRIATETFITTITNIDMNVADENGLKGFDQLCFTGSLEELKSDMGAEYAEFERILNERVQDYIRMETNPSVTIQGIYNQVSSALNSVMDVLSEQIKGIDVEQLGKMISDAVEKNGGVKK